MGASSEDVSLFLWDLWMIVVEIAFLTPADHPWQDILIGAIGNLRQIGGRVGSLQQEETPEWDDLPHLSAYLLDKWFDPTDLEAWTPEDVSSWKNINIFTAKLTSPDFAPWLTFPIWQLRSALEEPLEPGPILDSRLWVATEWILRSGQVVFEDMTSQDPLGEDTARALATGPLVEPGVSPRSSQRLSFWKNKLLEMHQDSQSLGLDDGTARRMKEAAEGIEQFEGKHRS